MSLTDMTIATAGEALATKKISAVELTAAHNDAIAALNPRLNAYIGNSHPGCMVCVCG